MKLLKKINNNFALAEDSNGEQIIVSGRGIGFQKMPCEITDLHQITRTYYDIDSRYVGLIKEISEEVFDISSKIAQYAKKKIDVSYNPNMVFILSDHIQFCIERYKKNMTFEYPLSYDFRQLHKKETEIGEYAVNLLNKTFQIKIPIEESIGIAMNILNSETVSETQKTDFNVLTSAITTIIESYFDIDIDRSSVNYSRFVTHLIYLFERVVQHKKITSENMKIYQSVVEETPETYRCVLKIKNYLLRKQNWYLEDEEILYLILHINRLRSNEDCYRKGITSDT